MTSTLIAESFPRDVFAMTRKDSGASYDIRMNMQWNTRPLGWLPEARSKHNSRAFRLESYARSKTKDKTRVTNGRKRKAHSYISKLVTYSDVNGKDLRQRENSNTCYINFPRLSMSKNDTTTNGESYKVSLVSNDPEPDKMASTPSKLIVSSQSTADNSKPGADIVVKKVSAYSSDFFKLNKQITNATDDLGGIKLSDILSNRKVNPRSVPNTINASAVVKSALSNTNKKLPELTNVKTTEDSVMILKGNQAPVKLKHQAEKNYAGDDVTESRDVTLSGSGVSLEEIPVSSHDVREVWCEDTDDDDGLPATSGILEDKDTESPAKLLQDNAPSERERSPNDYVITERILQKLQPPVPHVIWPDNKFMTHNTSFVYGSPSRLAPVIVPVHSVDCPISKMYFPSKGGIVCPPNSPTGFLTKEYGFYPVERHYGHSGS